MVWNINIALFRPMEFSMTLHTTYEKAVWSIVYTCIDGSKVIIPENIVMNVDFVFANSTNPDVLPHYA